MKLDSGDETTFKAGEMIVQRGTMHEWRNEGTETCRMLFVMVGSEEIVLGDGTRLEDTKMGGPPK